MLDRGWLWIVAVKLWLAVGGGDKIIASRRWLWVGAAISWPVVGSCYWSWIVVGGRTI